MNNMSNTYPLYTVFALFLMIAANFIGDLFPCKVQHLLNNNVLFKHFIAFLTLIFFVVLTDSNLNNNFNKMIIDAFKMYGVFLLLINCNINLFVVALLLLGVTYLLNLKINDLNDKIKKNKKNNNQIIQLEQITNINNILIYLFNIILVIGFIIYMGEKKIEYKNKFNYITFIFGKSKCRGFSPNTQFIQSLKAAFS